jgi:hypothetical protein
VLALLAYERDIDQPLMSIVGVPGKTRITIYIDDAVLNEFRARAERTGAGYQTMMNEALSAFLKKKEKPVTAAILRQISREELPEVSRLAGRPIRRTK